MFLQNMLKEKKEIKLNNKFEENKEKNQLNIEEIKKSNFEIQEQLNQLNSNYKNLLEKSNENNEEIKKIEEDIEGLNNNITLIIIKMKNLKEKIDDITMKDHWLKTEDEYIDSLRDKMEELGIKDEEQMTGMDKIKENNRIFREEINKMNKKK